MKTTLHCRTAPPLTRWAGLLVDTGWKIIDHEADRFRAKRQLGQSEYPQKNTTVWYISVEMLQDSQFEAEVSIDVPSFTDSEFSRARMYEEFDDIAMSVGNIQLQEEISVDLLTELRNK